MRLDFEQGVAFGQALEQIKEHGVQLEDHETRIGSLEGKAATAEGWIGRIMTAGGLWVAGTGLNLSAENVGQMIARILR
jgi:hypothetical protein